MQEEWNTPKWKAKDGIEYLESKNLPLAISYLSSFFRPEWNFGIQNINRN